MQRKFLWLVFPFVFIATILTIESALAHESITVGDYILEVGWLNEPPVVGQHNAVVVNVSTSDEQPVEDISSLTLTISYGGQEKKLTLEPVDEHSPGQFMAPILPTVVGEYALIFGGALGNTPVEAETHVEEVQPANTLAFPNTETPGQGNAGFGLTEWLAIAGLLSGLAGLVLSLINMRSRRL